MSEQNLKHNCGTESVFHLHTALNQDDGTPRVEIWTPEPLLIDVDGAVDIALRIMRVAAEIEHDAYLYTFVRSGQAEAEDISPDDAQKAALAAVADFHAWRKERRTQQRLDAQREFLRGLLGHDMAASEQSDA